MYDLCLCYFHELCITRHCAISGKFIGPRMTERISIKIMPVLMSTLLSKEQKEPQQQTMNLSKFECHIQGVEVLLLLIPCNKTLYV